MSQLKEHVSLRPYNSFGLEASARWWLEIEKESDLLEFLMDQPVQPGVPLMVLGGGSNILLTGDYEGLVLKDKLTGIEVVRENDREVLIRVGAGENWHGLVEYCLTQDWGGIENLSLIPGSVGAAPIQNIGAYGVELESVFHSLEALNLRTGSVHTFDRQTCRFGYRDSVFKGVYKGQYFITRVLLTLTKNTHTLKTHYGDIERELQNEGIHSPTLRDISRVICRIRQSKLPDPREIGNAGSFFKNPVISRTQFTQLQESYPDMPSYPQDEGKVKVPAAWLIQACGWKGKRFDHYGVHPRQALVLVNYGGAKGADILALSAKIQESVFDTFGIELEREVNVVG